MKTIFDHIERVQEKPHHIRKQIAFGAAAALTAVIALVWLVSSLGTGAFALKDTSFAQSAGEEGTFTATGDNKEQLAGVGASLLLLLAVGAEILAQIFRSFVYVLQIIFKLKAHLGDVGLHFIDNPVNFRIHQKFRHIDLALFNYTLDDFYADFFFFSIFLFDFHVLPQFGLKIFHILEWAQAFYEFIIEFR